MTEATVDIILDKELVRRAVASRQTQELAAAGAANQRHHARSRWWPIMKGRAKLRLLTGLQKGAQPGVPHTGHVGWEADDRLSWPAFGWVVVALVFLLAAIVGLSHALW